ncbi:hypothetical protein B0H66DRAFT_371881 [Apodospora peruviana]|uniref:Uncharacterized protein n=1 Tax=Apodospora peruviana TaxID=516989 RepID=A0AAE0M026_9PEZI|nr:hypothetical protein B0H66DRAFT_371881 [Apodospora peruviana]
MLADVQAAMTQFILEFCENPAIAQRRPALPLADRRPPARSARPPICQPRSSDSGNQTICRRHNKLGVHSRTPWLAGSALSNTKLRSRHHMTAVSGSEAALAAWCWCCCRTGFMLIRSGAHHLSCFRALPGRHKGTNGGTGPERNRCGGNARKPKSLGRYCLVLPPSEVHPDESRGCPGTTQARQSGMVHSGTNAAPESQRARYPRCPSCGELPWLAESLESRNKEEAAHQATSGASSCSLSIDVFRPPKPLAASILTWTMDANAM